MVSPRFIEGLERFAKSSAKVVDEAAFAEFARQNGFDLATVNLCDSVSSAQIHRSQKQQVESLSQMLDNERKHYISLLENTVKVHQKTTYLLNKLSPETRFDGHNLDSILESIEKKLEGFQVSAGQYSKRVESLEKSLIESNLDKPTRELMWGSPGTLLASLFLHQHTGEARWAELYQSTAGKLWSQLLWSEEHQCHYWTQDMYGSQSTYLDAVHGFVATASPLIRGRHLLGATEWAAWQGCIENTIRRTAVVEDGLANWPARLVTPGNAKRAMLMQFCHGAPGFVICLADMPGAALDDLLLAAGEATWQAGPLAKGSNLCHGTGGNGYAFLKLFVRTGDPLWLARARAFAMHGIAQTEAEAATHGRMRYSLWTGDPGFAIYLWDCVHGTANFPTLDVFFGGA